MYDYIFGSSQNKVTPEGGKMDKLSIAIKLYEIEVKEQEISLIERGMPPHKAHKVAVDIVRNRRNDEYISKSKA